MRSCTGTAPTPCSPPEPFWTVLVTFFVPSKSATAEVGPTQYGTKRRVTCPSSERSATLRRKTPLFSHLPPVSVADSFESRLSSMKCLWNISTDPPAPIVVTAPQYSQVANATPEEGFSVAPQELHFSSFGKGGAAAG